MGKTYYYAADLECKCKFFNHEESAILPTQVKLMKKGRGRVLCLPKLDEKDQN